MRARRIWKPGKVFGADWPSHSARRNRHARYISQTLFEDAVRNGDDGVAVDLLEYFWNEMYIMAEALFTWLGDIFAYRAAQWGVGEAAPKISGLLQGLRGYDPSSGDRARAIDAVSLGKQDEAIAAGELMRVRYASLKDGLVVWVQELLADLSVELGEEAVRESVEVAYENLWKHRYAPWGEMTPLERVQLVSRESAATSREEDDGAI